MKSSVKVFVAVAVVIVVAAAAIFGFGLFATRRQTVRYVTRPVSYADISASVTETGTLDPVDEVTVGTEVSGTIRSLFVDYNSTVTKGEVLATLDPSTFQDALDQARANLQLAEANLHSAELNVVKTKAQYDLAALTEQRDQPLLEQNFISQSQIDTDKTNSLVANQE